MSLETSIEALAESIKQLATAINSQGSQNLIPQEIINIDKQDVGEILVKKKKEPAKKAVAKKAVAEAEVKIVSFEQAKEKLIQYGAINGTAKAEEIIHSFDAKKLSDLTAAQRVEMVVQIEGLENV